MTPISSSRSFYRVISIQRYYHENCSQSWTFTCATSMFDSEGKIRIVTPNPRWRQSCRWLCPSVWFKYQRYKYCMAVLSFGWIKEPRTISSTGLQETWWKVRQASFHNNVSGHSSDDWTSFKYYNAGRGRFFKFGDGAPRLSAGVREIDGIDSFFPSLLLLIVEPWK